jgi:hypothetical protein
MLVLEDLHWSGRSTQDFAVALTRRGRGRLLLVLTFQRERQCVVQLRLLQLTAEQAVRRASCGHLCHRLGGACDPETDSS